MLEKLNYRSELQESEGGSSSVRCGFAMRLCSAFLVLVCAMALQGSAATYALVVGISDYQESAWHLKYGAEDARRVYSALLTACSVDASRIELLTDAAATKSSIERALADLTAMTTAGDTVVFYFSGHGTRVVDTDGDEEDGLDEALVPQDAVPGREDSVIVDDVLGWWVARMPAANVIVILDSCYSGGQGRSVDMTSVQPKGPADSMVKDIFSDTTGRSGRFLLAASESGQSAFEGYNLEGGAFTHFLVQGLTTMLADTDRDDRVTLEELAAFAHAQVSRWAGSESVAQTTVFEEMPGSATIVLVPAIGAIGAVPSLRAGLAVEPVSIDFGTEDVTRPLSLSVTDGAEVEYAIRVGASWVSCSRIAGNVLAGRPQTIYVTVDRTQLSTGRHSADLVVSYSGSVNPVTVRVTAAGSVEGPAPTTSEPTNGGPTEARLCLSIDAQTMLNYYRAFPLLGCAWPGLRLTGIYVPRPLAYALAGDLGWADQALLVAKAEITLFALSAQLSPILGVWIVSNLGQAADYVANWADLGVFVGMRFAISGNVGLTLGAGLDVVVGAGWGSFGIASLEMTF